MKRIISIVIALLAILSSSAQKSDGVVRGKIIDTAQHAPIVDATISIIQVSDSSLVTYTLSSKQGAFEIKGLRNGFYRVIISHQEFNEIKRDITINTSNNQVDLGEIILTKVFKLLGEVAVRSESPIIIKGDTLQFNTTNIKTRPNATVEDLLKKLPGVELDRDGNVKTQGEQVQKIYVDGKEFFGNDPKLATKNLGADMVESIQVFDETSEQSKFTKIDDGSRSKAINIKLKKDRNHGYFGKALAAYGDRGHYEGNIGFNKFAGNQRLSILFNTNDINKQGFSFSDIGGSSGGNRGASARGSGSVGLTKTTSAGLNYNDQLGEKFKLSTSYFFGSNNTRQEQSVLRKSNFTDSTAILQRDGYSDGKNQNHRLNFRLEYQIDSMNSILYTPSFVISDGFDDRRDSNYTISQVHDIEYLSITGMTRNSSDRKAFNFNHNLLFRHRFHKIGRTLTVGWNSTMSNNKGEGLNRSFNSFFLQDGTPMQVISQDQQSFNKNTANNNVLTTTYTEPLGADKLLELNYSYTRNESVSDRKTYDYNPGTDAFDLPNLLQTNIFENVFLAHRAGFNYRMQRKKYNYQVGLGVERSILENNSFLAITGKDSLSRQYYTNFFPTANFNFIPSRNQNIRFSYNGRTNQPSISQLQNVLDVTDPLNVRTGNPQLRQEFNHDFSMGYNSFNVRTFRLVAANLGLASTVNRIVSSIDTLSPGVQLTKPENVNGNYRAYSFVTLGFPFKNPELKGSNITFTNSISYNRAVSLIYKQRNIGKTLNVTQGVGINITKEKLDLGIRANLTYNKVRYSVNELLNEKFLTQTYSADVSYIFKGDLILANSFDYLINTGRAEGYNQSVPLWNASISKLIFRKKNGEIKLLVNDILNQNQSINRYAGDNYIQDTRSMVLRRYFMLSFMYNLNKMGKQPR